MQELKELDLIDEKEFVKRLEEFNKKYASVIEDSIKILVENKTSWGTMIERNARIYSDKTALKFEEISLTHKEFNEWVNRYANYFISKGVKKGEVIEVLVTNRPEYLFIFTALGKIGAIGSLINTDQRKNSLVHSLKLTLERFIIVDEISYEAFKSVQPTLNLSSEHVLLFLPDKGKIPLPKGFIDLSKTVRDFSIENPVTTSKVKGSDQLAYIFTSGTTGLPKASIFSHSRMVGACYGGFYALKFTSDDIIYVPLPFFHTTALLVGWGVAVGPGAAVALSRKLTISRFWDDIKKFEATAFCYVGEVCRYLLNKVPTPYDKENNVKTIIGNGLRPDIWKKFKKRFDIQNVVEVYGASEISRGFGNLLNFDCTVGFSSNSYAIVKYNIEEEKPIFNKDGFMDIIGLGGTGLLLWEIDDETVFRGYTNKEATERKIFRNVFKKRDNYFNSGDLMRDQGCNHVQFIDRLGDTFRWKAQNVSTTEVEEVLNVFEQISMSSAYGVKIPGTDGRAGMASIVSNVEIKDFDFNNLIIHLKSNLPSYAIPIFIRFKSGLSATSTFKFRKVDLKKEGFKFETMRDQVYILLSNESKYMILTKNILERINQRKYKF